jgi:hypothetical protein
VSGRRGSMDYSAERGESREKVSGQSWEKHGLLVNTMVVWRRSRRLTGREQGWGLEEESQRLLGELFEGSEPSGADRSVHDPVVARERDGHQGGHLLEGGG